MEHEQQPTTATSLDEPPPAEEPSDEHTQGEAEIDRLEDRIGAFTSYTIAADFLELRQIFAGTFERMKEEDWGKRTERRAEAWTRQQTLAHLDASTWMFNTSIEAGLEGRPVEVPGMTVRSDLKAVNEATIAERAERPIDELMAAFLGELDRGARLAAPLAKDELGRLVPVPYYGAIPTVAELFGAALAHTGVVHGAQVALARARPIWIYFQPGMMRRQLTRFLHMLGLAYWPERGGDLHATFSLQVEGQGGGSWFIRVEPEGGHGKIGVARTSDVRFTFASAERFCQFMTFQTPIWRALMLRHVRVRGNLRLALRMPELFLPT
jgi:hypothetical protein